MSCFEEFVYFIILVIEGLWFDCLTEAVVVIIFATLSYLTMTSSSSQLTSAPKLSF